MRSDQRSTRRRRKGSESIAVTRILGEKEATLQTGNRGKRRRRFPAWPSTRARERRGRSRGRSRGVGAEKREAGARRRERGAGVERSGTGARRGEIGAGAEKERIEAGAEREEGRRNKGREDAQGGEGKGAGAWRDWWRRQSAGAFPVDRGDQQAAREAWFETAECEQGRCGGDRRGEETARSSYSG